MNQRPRTENVSAVSVCSNIEPLTDFISGFAERVVCFDAVVTKKYIFFTHKCRLICTGVQHKHSTFRSYIPLF